jgi:hypothetical protein
MAPPGRRQLGVTRKGGAAEADDAGIAQDFAHPLGRQAAVIERRARDPLVAAVRLDDHTQRRQARGMRGDMLFDGQHGAGGRRMHRRRHPAVGATDHLPLEHVLADLDQRIGRTADVLMQRHEQARRQRRLANRQLHRRRLVGRRLDAPLEAEQSGQHCGGLRRHA